MIINSIMKNNYKLDNQQETLLKGSSETTRETTFNLDMLWWFVGFLEGDGFFVFSNARWFFIITQNELVVLYKIKKFLNRGRVQKHGAYFRYIITKKNDFHFIIELIYKYIVLQKTFLKVLNYKIYGDTTKVNLQQFEFYKNAWLSGFIDAEGCFNIRLAKRVEYKCGYQIRLLFILDQKLLVEDKVFFEHLRQHIGGYVINRKNENFRLFVEKEEDISTLIRYLKRYPLRSHKKTIQFKHWLQVWRIKNQNEVTLKDIEKIQKIKSWRYSPPKYESI